MEEFLRRFSESQTYRWRFYSLAIRAHFFAWVGFAAVSSFLGWRWVIDAVLPGGVATTMLANVLGLWTEHRYLVRYLAGRYPDQYGPDSEIANDPLAWRFRFTKEVLFGRHLATDGYVKEFRAGRLVLFRLMILSMFSCMGIVLAAHLVWALVTRLGSL